jgi:hypothetical protein
MKSHELSVRIGSLLRQLIHTDAALRACARTPTKDHRSHCQEISLATRTTKAQYKCTNDANKEDSKDDYSEPIYKPGSGLPDCSQDADGNQAQPQEAEPRSKRPPDSHGLGNLLVEIHAAIGTVFNLRPDKAKCRRHCKGDTKCPPNPPLYGVPNRHDAKVYLRLTHRTWDGPHAEVCLCRHRSGVTVVPSVARDEWRPGCPSSVKLSTVRQKDKS